MRSTSEYPLEEEETEKENAPAGKYGAFMIATFGRNYCGTSTGPAAYLASLRKNRL